MRQLLEKSIRHENLKPVFQCGVRKTLVDARAGDIGGHQGDGAIRRRTVEKGMIVIKEKKGLKDIREIRDFPRSSGIIFYRMSF